MFIGHDEVMELAKLFGGVNHTVLIMARAMDWLAVNSSAVSRERVILFMAMTGFGNVGLASRDDHSKP